MICVIELGHWRRLAARRVWLHGVVLVRQCASDRSSFSRCYWSTSLDGVRVSMRAPAILHAHPYKYSHHSWFP